tara:strand:- start:3522 stop:4067 length:546 start_codon:yes stop_codon:yes gene_type:complete
MKDRLKRTNDELKADRPTIGEIQFINKTPIYIMLENIRSVHNVGSIFRTADGFGVSKILLTGYTAYPPRDDLSKTALGADKVVSWEHFDNPLDAIEVLKKNSIHPIAIEQTINSKCIFDYEFNFPSCFILGNEVNGISEDLLNCVSDHIEISMKGIKQSFNVSVAAGIVCSEMTRQNLLLS